MMANLKKIMVRRINHYENTVEKNKTKHMKNTNKKLRRMINMNLIIEITKEIFQASIALIILGFITKLFLAHTLIGKIISITIKNIYLSIRGILRVIKYVGEKIFNIGKSTNNYLSKKKPVKQNQKKVVNGGSNIIDYKTAKKLRHKWH